MLGINASIPTYSLTRLFASSVPSWTFPNRDSSDRVANCQKSLVGNVQPCRTQRHDFLKKSPDREPRLAGRTKCEEIYLTSFIVLITSHLSLQFSYTRRQNYSRIKAQRKLHDMDGPSFWKQSVDFSLFLPDQGLNMFGDSSFDFDFNAGPCLDFDYSSTVQHEVASNYKLETTSSTYPGTASLMKSHHNPKLSQGPIFKGTATIEANRSNTNTPPRSVSARGSDQLSETADPDTRSSSENLKRKIDQSVIVFSSTSNKEVTPRKRKNFSASRRKEVALNRMCRVCIQCKLRKSRVSACSIRFQMFQNLALSTLPCCGSLADLAVQLRVAMRALHRASRKRCSGPPVVYETEPLLHSLRSHW